MTFDDAWDVFGAREVMVNDDIRCAVLTEDWQEAGDDE